MIKACIFDLDGVIVDTAKYHFIAWRRLANSLGFDFSEEENEKLKGVSRIESLNLILRWGGIEKTEAEKEELANLKNNWYREYILKMDSSEILEGVIPFLDHLEQQGLVYVEQGYNNVLKESGNPVQATKSLKKRSAITRITTATARSTRVVLQKQVSFSGVIQPRQSASRV